MSKVNERLGYENSSGLGSWVKRSQAKDRLEVTKPNLDFSYLIPGIKLKRAKHAKHAVKCGVNTNKTMFAYLKDNKQVRLLEEVWVVIYLPAKGMCFY